MKKNLLTLIMFLVTFSTIYVTTHATTNGKVQSIEKQNIEIKYKDNSNKNFEKVDSFYSKIKSSDGTSYHEFPDATVNIRKKIKYKEIGNVVNNLGKYSDPSFSSKIPNISPDRQVYLLISIKDEGEYILSKEAIYDAETQVLLESGEGRKLKKKEGKAS
nr:hypothetical protein [Paenibacillus bovis]